MRISRRTQLHVEKASTHTMWRCHNREYYLRSNSMKTLYMNSVSEGLKPEVSKNCVKIHAYCIMDNHCHQAISYEEDSQHLSKFMHHAHSLFGSKYNRIHKRSGKVAESRPKTSLIENVEHEMRVHFYIEANPIRAGLCKPENLKHYKFNSFKFYAYGIEDEFTKLLTIPEWYYKLGPTDRIRQRNYRKLFYEYLSTQEQTAWLISNEEELFIGSSLWVSSQKERVKLFLPKILNTS